MPTINLALEEQIIDYLIATLDPLNLTASYYAGLGNVQDLQAPAVVVSAPDGTEVYYQSNVYEMFVNIDIKEMAADTNSGSLGVLAHNIENCFWNQVPQQAIIETALNQTGSHNFVTYQCQSQGVRHSKNEDALISEMTLRVVGTLSGSMA